jgi:hypothetical protein
LGVTKRKGSTNSVVEKSKKSLKKAKKDINNTSMANSKYGAILGILVLLFGIIYVAFLGDYVYKRKKGHPSALNQNPNPFGNIANLDMDAFRKAIKIDENGKVTFSEEDLEKFKEVFVDVNGNAQVPPKDNGDENVEEVGNESGESGESGDQAKAQEQADAKDEAKVEKDASADAAADATNKEEKKKNSNEEQPLQRQRRSLNYDDGNAPDETGEMSDYLSNLLTSGPSANFVDLLRNKIVILNPFNDGREPTAIGSTQYLRQRRSINQHMFASGSSKFLKD